ncbi:MULTISPECIES: hypothetical protein [unclassified Paenibacillus]|uniref:hypothetical protein n=1 Tax=unclassified Paenibacillus TaxID=185978 RepID=UPI001AE1CC73|nr:MULTISPECIES: hypothetical protein [unclassified Paenibacillus]MBP1153953.1 hypothetical protein [Paenibacillus sp. PvP091]MBP1170662.1 hypothetical protein [Paenibacillus sp. PvR098]MBP2441690.1 hypothetical protein [Paenibacillus sp. PvP052]
MRMETVVALVKGIQKKDQEVAEMESMIAISAQEKLNQIIHVAVNGLEFEVINKTAFFHDEDEEVAQVEDYFLDDEGNVLKGVKVLVMIEDSSDEEDEEEWELHKEVFLFDDGTFKTFDTIYRTFNCSDCDVVHKSISREVAEVDYESEYRYELIISNIIWRLNERAEALETKRNRLAERLEKLNMLMVSYGQGIGRRQDR